MNQPQHDSSPITNWRQYTAQIRAKGRGLLKTLDDFSNAVLVTGCQRSGTTMMSRIIFQSEGMVNYWTGKDDELDAALILAGVNPPPSPGRYCFQTTFLDGFYKEYYQHTGNYKIIWVLRNPYSVVTSLLYNWAPPSLDGTFESFPAKELKGMDAARYRLRGIKAFSRPRRACEIFKAKTTQLFELYEAFGPEKIMIVDYDDLVLHKETILPTIYDFIDLAYDPAYHEKIHHKSLKKKSRLTEEETSTIRKHAEPIYNRAIELKKSQQA